MTQNEKLGRWLRRLLAPGRFGPLVLWLRDGRRVEVARREEVWVHEPQGIIELVMAGDVQEILMEDVLAVGLRPRCPGPRESRP